MKNWIVTVSALLCATVAMPAQAASLMGDQMRTSWRLPTETNLFSFNMSPSKTFTVGKGVEGEVQLTTILFTVDFGADTLTFTFRSSGLFANHGFNGIYFEQLGDGAFGEILSVSGIGTNRLHNMGNAFSVNFAGQRYVAGDKVTINFVPEVPEPASWALMIGGFGLAGGALRRTRRSALTLG